MQRQSLLIFFWISTAVGGPRERNKTTKEEWSLPCIFSDGELKQSSHSGAVVSNNHTRSKTEEQWHCRSCWAVNSVSQPQFIREWCETTFTLKLEVKIYLGSQKKMFTAWCWDANGCLFKSTELNQDRLTLGGESGGRGVPQSRESTVQEAARLETRQWKSWGHLPTRSALHIYSTMSCGSRQLCVSGGPREREAGRERECWS